MLLNRYTGEIVGGNPYLNELLWYDDGNGIVPFWKMRREIRKRRFDAVVVVYPRFRLACLMALAGIPLRVGTGFRAYSFLFNRRVFEHRKNAARHEVDYNIGLIRELGCIPRGEPEFLIHIPEDARRSVEEILGEPKGRRIIVIHPGSGGSAREWPAAHFGSLASRLLQQGDATIYVTGTQNEKSKVDAVVALAGHGAVSLAGELTVKQLAALLSVADLFVANSTGPLHIAAALGTPVLGLYPQHTPMSAKRWGPRTEKKRVYSPQRREDCRDCVDGTSASCECMASISVDTVYSGARELLEERRGGDE
jgi:ADP-heptose:LPS heptosyltransferase